VPEENLIAPELAPPAIEPDEPRNDNDSLPQVEAEAEVTLQEDDLEEFEFDGKQIKGPKGLKDRVLMHADYTRKTQEVASERKALTERAALIDQQAKASEEELSHRVQMSKIDSEIERFKGFEWAQYQALRQTDPAQAEEAWAYKQHLNNLKNDTKSKLDTAVQTRTQAAERDIATRAEETEKYAKEHIKGWTPEISHKVIEFALAKGMTPEFLQRNMSPHLYETLNLARIGETYLKTSAAPKVPTPQPPLTVVGGKSNPGSPVRSCQGRHGRIRCPRNAEEKAERDRKNRKRG
jgi:type II secretory pathway pseudopilin PulG